MPSARHRRHPDPVRQAERADAQRGKKIAHLVAEAVDIAVRLGPLSDSGLVVAKLGEIRRYLCAAPAYLKRRGTLLSGYICAPRDCGW